MDFFKDTNQFRTFFVKNYIKFIPKSKFIGVLGTTDTEITIDLAKAVLSNFPDEIVKMESLSGNIFKVNHKVKKVLLNLNPNQLGDIDFFLDMITPQTLIIDRFLINTFENQTEDFLNIEVQKLLGKIPKDSLLILNGDDNLIKKLTEEVSADKIFFGTDSKTSDAWAGNMRIKNFKLSFELNYGVERVEINSLLFGFNQIYPILAAASLGISLDIPLLIIKKNIEKVAQTEQRMEVLNGPNGSVTIADTANSNAFAAIESIDSLNHVSARRRILVLGDLENGEKAFKEIARKIFKDKLDLVLLCGEENQKLAEELDRLGFLPERLKANLQIPQTISQLLSVLGRGDIVLIEGGDNLKLSEVVKRISKK